MPSSSSSFSFICLLFFGGASAGLIKTAVGLTAGGIFGMIMFRSGKGMRAASLATGVGVAAGSTYERVMAQHGSSSMKE